MIFSLIFIYMELKILSLSYIMLKIYIRLKIIFVERAWCVAFDENLIL